MGLNFLYNFLNFMTLSKSCLIKSEGNGVPYYKIEKKLWKEISRGRGSSIFWVEMKKGGLKIAGKPGGYQY